MQNNSILNGSGTYIQTAGSTTIGLGSSFTQRTLQIDLGSFTDYGAVTITGDATNSGSLTIDGASGIMTVDGTYTQTGADASTLLLEGGTFDPPAIDIEGGVFGGAGTVDGPVTLTGDSTLQVGDPTGELELDGDHSQTGGQIVFDVESNGEGGFDVSTLDFVNGANDVDIVIDFLDGADPSLYAPGGLNIADFFQVTGNSSFLADFGNVFSGDTFTMEGTNLTNTDLDFDPTTGGLVPEEEGPGPLSTPEPSTLLLLLPGLGILRLRFSRRRVRRPAPSV